MLNRKIKDLDYVRIGLNINVMFLIYEHLIKPMFFAILRTDFLIKVFIYHFIEKIPF